MSGGSLNYIYSSICEALNMPYGSYGIGQGKFNDYEDNVCEVIKTNRMEDLMLSVMMYDVACLLHSLEWYDSGDIGREKYMLDVETFKKKWLFKNNEDAYMMYKENVKKFLNTLTGEIDGL